MTIDPYVAQGQGYSAWCKDNAAKYRLYEFDHQIRTVLDLGGYKGEWAEVIIDKHDPEIVIVEPVLKYSDFLNEKFKDNPKCTIIRAIASDYYGEKQISVSEESSSVHIKSDETETVPCIQTSNIVFKEKPYDLVKINVEGEEFDILNDLIATGKIQYIHTLVVQFHPFINNSGALREEIQSKLRLTHDKVFDYPFIWECWRRKAYI